MATEFSINTNSNPDNIFFRCVEDSSEAIMITDNQGKLVYVNAAWIRIYGYSKSEALQKTPKILQSGQHSIEFYKEMWNQIQNPEIGFWKGEVINKTKSGDFIPVLLTITPFKTYTGEVHGFMGLAVDISHKKQLEAQVIHQDRLATIGMIASGLAHEVGTPLGVIRGRAEMMQMNEKEESVKKNFDVIISQIDRISKLIRSLLRVSRSTSDVRLEDIFINDVVQEISSLIEKEIKEVGFKIEFAFPQSIKVRADSNRLEQVILNLVVNSIHALKKSKEIDPNKKLIIKFETIIKNSKTILKIIDTGTGISPQDLKKLFQPFFTTKDIGEGTGLGLTIVAQLIQEMNGEITVESTLGVGTTFLISLDSA